MRLVLILPLLLALHACNSSSSKTTDAPPEKPVTTGIINLTEILPQDVKLSVVRINSTQQAWNPWQPWEKQPPTQRRALAAIIGPQLVITTAELTANATYLEFESSDGTRFAPAKVIARDYEANLALLGPENDKEGAAFFESTVPFEITSPPALGDSLDILQIEENGVALQTPGILQSIDLTSNFLPNHSFITYIVKASMQSAASSYSLPVLHEGKLAGVLISYDSKDQLCDVTCTDILTRFLNESMSGNYHGFPSLGIRIARTEDSSFRQWLKLTDDQGGLFIQSVSNGSAAEDAGLKNGDVLLAVDGNHIDRRGYYEHPRYGSLAWSHLIRGEKSIGSPALLSILRDGKVIEITATLKREEESDRLVPDHLFDQAPNYLLKGGLLFQELSRDILEGYGKDWTSRAPLNLLDAYENPEKFQDQMRRVVFLSGVIPTPATIGYERLRNMIVKKVNGKEIKDMKSLVEAFNKNSNELHSIEFFDEHLVVYLDNRMSTVVDDQLLQRGISHLFRAD